MIFVNNEKNPAYVKIDLDREPNLFFQRSLNDLLRNLELSKERLSYFPPDYANKLFLFQMPG